MIISFLKDVIFYFLNLFNSSLKRKASILMYHSIGDNNAFFTVSPKVFDKQLAYLKTKNFSVIKLSDLINRLKTGQDISNCVCLTFDDGYLDNLTIALPILKKYNFPATIFIATGFLGKIFYSSQGISLPVMSEHDIKKFASQQIEFMPHTVNHVLLDILSVNDYDKELLKSREKIEQLTEKPANILAYPKGKYNQNVIEYLKLNNWDGAVTVEEGLVKMGDDRFKLKRNSIDSTTSFIQFKSKVSGTIDIYQKIKSWLKL